MMSLEIIYFYLKSSEIKMIIWPTKKLGEIAQLRMGETLIKKDLTGDGVPVYSADSLDNPWGYTSKNKLKFHRGAIVIGARGTIGSLKLPEDGYFTSTQTTILVEPNKKEILPRFLFYFLNTLDFKKFTVGTGIPMITVGYLNTIKIPLPPLPVQKAIVERLDAIKKAQELNDRQIALADELFQSLLYRELDPKKKNWKSKRLRDVAEITMGQSPPSTTYNMEGNGLPFFQGKFEFKEIYPIPIKFCSQPIRIAKKNDVLLSVRAPVGPVNLAPSECCIGRGLSAIRANVEKLDQFFLFYFMKLNENKTSFLGSGSTFTAIGRNRIEDIKIPLPPLSTQHQIVQKLQAVQEYKKKLIEQKQKLKELFESCLNKAMKGELVT